MYRFPVRQEPLLWGEISAVLFFFSFGGLFSVLYWPIAHVEEVILVSALLFCLSVILWIPIIIYEDQKIPGSTLSVLHNEAERFPLVLEVWKQVCAGKHPSWMELDTIEFWVRKGGLPVEH